MRLHLRDVRKTERNRRRTQTGKLDFIVYLPTASQIQKRSVMASHTAKIEALFTQLAFMKVIVDKPLKVAFLLLTLSEHRNYAAVVTSLKTLGDQ